MTLRAAGAFVEPPVYTPTSWGLWASIQQAVDLAGTDVLAESGQEPDVGGDHWQLGVFFESDSFAEAGITTDPCTGAPGTKTPTQTGIGVRGAMPFTVYAEIDCSPVGHYDDFSDRSVQALRNGEARAVEREFWAGAGGTMPHLAANAQVSENGQVMQTAAIDLNAGGDMDVEEAIANLEANLVSCYGGLGVIHVPWIAVPALFGRPLIVKDGPRLRTQLGTLVVVGSGYPGTAPDGTVPPAGHVYLYATGAIKGWRSKISVTGPRSSLDRSKNTMVMVAERTYVLAVDSLCHFGVRVQVGGQATGIVNSPS